MASIKRYHVPPTIPLRYHPYYPRHRYHLDTTLDTGTTLVPLSGLSQCVDHFDLTGIVLPSGTICQLSNMIDCPPPCVEGREGRGAAPPPKKFMGCCSPRVCIMHGSHKLSAIFVNTNLFFNFKSSTL